MRPVTRVLALAASGLVTITGLALAPGVAASDPGDDYLARARTRAAAAEYSGQVRFEWTDERGAHRAVLDVRHEDGRLEVAAERRVVMGPEVQALGDADGWKPLGPTEVSGTPPVVSAKYLLDVRPADTTVAGRSATRVDVRARASGAVVERLFVDDPTGVVLRREWYDAEGRPARVVAFVEISADADAGGMAVWAPPSSAPPAGSAPVGDLGAPYLDPAEVGDGFQLVGRSRHDDGLVQLHYTDGVLELSVFEQPGRLDWTALPPGGSEGTVDGARARRYLLAAGQALVWEDGGLVITCVTDAPVRELQRAAVGLARAGRPGLVERVADLVLRPFSW